MFNNKIFIFYICDIWFACLQTNIMRKTQNISNCLYQSLGILITHNIFASSRKINYPRCCVFWPAKGCSSHHFLVHLYYVSRCFHNFFINNGKNMIKMLSTSMYLPQILKNKVDIQWLYNTWSLFHIIVVKC